MRECLVSFGESASVELLGITAFDDSSQRDALGGVEKQSNRLDATFVYGGCRVCVYNADALYSGSPWHTPGYPGPTGALATTN
ncbi:MAG: hypothetical protein U1F83_05600 [Verrucomicrobiota bacterium]